MNPDQSIIFKLLAHQELNEFQEFIRNHWGKDHLFAIESSVFNWQHRGPSYYHNMTVEFAEKLIGVMCVIPQRQFDNNLPINQIFYSLLKVSGSKFPGIVFGMYQNIIKHYKPDFIGSIGFNNQMINFHKWLKFEVGIMNHSFALSPFLDSFKIAGLPKNYEIKSGKIDKRLFWKKANEKTLKSIKLNEIFS